MEINKDREAIKLVIFAVCWGILSGLAYRYLVDIGILDTLKINQVIFWL
jgi:hypothetical protein